MIYICPLGISATVSCLPPYLLFIHHHNHRTLILPHSLCLFFIPHSHRYHIRGRLYLSPRKYHHIWLSCLPPSPWQNIMLLVTLGCCHLHNNCLVHTRFHCYHCGGAVDYSSGCQNLLCAPARPRWCSLVSIQKLARFSSVDTYHSYIALLLWWLILLFWAIMSI